MKKGWYKVLGCLCGVGVAIAAVTAAELMPEKKSDDRALGRNMEIMLNVMREVATSYVDEVSSDKLVADAAAGMLSKLDPYTEDIPES